MEKIAGVDVGQESPMKKIAFVSFVRTAIEFYDFYIYGTAAALVFGAVFFPEFSPASATPALIATSGVALLARPLGGAIFGHYGDRVGRKAMLISSLLVMGLATFFVGLLPGYAAIGVVAPLRLVFLRFLQGTSLGGEWGGAVLMAAEHDPPGKRAFYSGFAQMGPPVGFLLPSGAFLLFASVLSEEQFASWGWRVPFLFGIVLVAVGLFVRLNVSETPVFKEVIETQTESQFFSELFGTRVRYSGASLSYALAGVLGGALVPYIAARLLGATGASWSVLAYLAAMAAISFVSVFLLSEPYRSDLSETKPKECQLIVEGEEKAAS